jgi:transposase
MFLIRCRQRSERREVAMPAAVRLREDYGPSDLRALVRHAETARQAARLVALAGVAEGRSRAEAARLGGMDRQTLRDWVHRFNAYGPDGLIDRQAPGPACRLTPAQRAELAQVIKAGPDPERDGVVRWRRSDLRRLIRERYGVDYHERHVGRLLGELGFSHISARPQHVGQPPASEAEAFKKTSPTTSPAS